MGRCKNENVFYDNKINVNNTKIINKAYFCYYDMFYNSLKKINLNIDDSALKIFANKFIKNYTDKFILSASQFNAQMLTVINRDIEKYKKDKSFFVKRYILFCSYKENIEQLLYYEFKDLLDAYKDTYIYKDLCGRYSKILKDAVLNINSMNYSLRGEVKKRLHEENLRLKNILNEKISKARTDENIKKELYYELLPLKSIMFNKYKNINNLSDDIVKNIIDKAYDEYFLAYFKGNSNRNLRHYLCTRFSEKFHNQILPLELTDEAKEEINYYYYSKLHFIDEYMNIIIDDLKINLPFNIIKEELLKTYKLSLEEYYLFNYSTYTTSYIHYRLEKKIKELEKTYSNKKIMELSNKFKKIARENNLIDLNILDEVINNLTNYYLLLKVNNDKPYEIYMINEINNFNYERYLKIKQVKENINCKILKHSNL